MYDNTNYIKSYAFLIYDKPFGSSKFFAGFITDSL
jgi:hypothetical protein